MPTCDQKWLWCFTPFRTVKTVIVFFFKSSQRWWGIRTVSSVSESVIVLLKGTLALSQHCWFNREWTTCLTMKTSAASIYWQIYDQQVKMWSLETSVGLQFLDVSWQSSLPPGTAVRVSAFMALLLYHFCLLCDSEVRRRFSFPS